MHIGVRHLYEIAEDFVVADLERVDAGPGAFLSLNPGDGILAPVAQRPPFVQLAVDPVAHTGLIPNRNWRSVDECSDDLVGKISATIPHASVSAECGIVFGCRHRTSSSQR